VPTYIDIGSQIGDEIAIAIENGYEVHSFEPNPKHQPYLKKYEDKAKINYAAAWNYDGEIDFYTNNNSPEKDVSSSVVTENTNARGRVSIKVPCINIGRYLKELDRDIDILKIDAEGAEYYIIESILDNFDHKRIKKWKVEDHEGYIIPGEWFSHRERVLNRIRDLGITINEWENELLG